MYRPSSQRNRTWNFVGVASKRHMVIEIQLPKLNSILFLKLPVTNTTNPG